MKITGYFHLFPGEHNAGSETTVHAALRAMVRRGHVVNVICDRSITAPYTIDGINVIRPPRRGQQSWLQDYVKDCDLLVTHLDLTSQAMQLALASKKPLVHFVHNDMQLMYWHVNTLKAQLVVFNSQWIADKKCAWMGEETKCVWPGPSIVIHPVVEPEHYRCSRGDGITLVNPTPGKGVSTFKAIASQMPDRKFLAVEGGYGEQKITKSYDNVEWIPHTPDIREVLCRTRVLLMPSDYESYGRIGIEAACAGIPTIAHPTRGLKEAFGDAAIFIDRNEIAEWYVEIERLFKDEIYYRKRSDAALELANSLTPEPEFDRLEQAFIKTVQRWKVTEAVKPMIWKSDRRIWRLADGSFKAETNGRIPVDAVSMYAGIGTDIPEDIAIKNGWLSPETKAIESSPENKAIEAPQENKARGRKKRVA